MRYLYHKQPLVIKAKKQNEYHDRFNEKVFYRGSNPHTAATYRLLHLSKKIKFLFVLFVATMIVLGIGYINSMRNTQNTNAKFANNKTLIDEEDKDQKHSDYELITDVSVTPDEDN